MTSSVAPAIAIAPEEDFSADVPSSPSCPISRQRDQWLLNPEAHCGSADSFETLFGKMGRASGYWASSKSVVYRRFSNKLPQRVLVKIPANRALTRIHIIPINVENDPMCLTFKYIYSAIKRFYQSKVKPEEVTAMSMVLSKNAMYSLIPGQPWMTKAMGEDLIEDGIELLDLESSEFVVVLRVHAASWETTLATGEDPEDEEEEPVEDSNMISSSEEEEEALVDGREEPVEEFEYADELEQTQPAPIAEEKEEEVKTTLPLPLVPACGTTAAPVFLSESEEKSFEKVNAIMSQILELYDRAQAVVANVAQIEDKLSQLPPEDPHAIELLREAAEQFKSLNANTTYNGCELIELE